MVYTLSRAIKEEKKNEERVGFSHVAGGREKRDNFSLFFDCQEKQKVRVFPARRGRKIFFLWLLFWAERESLEEEVVFSTFGCKRKETKSSFF